MKAIVCKEFAPVSALTYMDVDDPIAKAGEVVLDVAAAGVNFPDSLLVEGLYQMKPELPFIPGSEVAGIISQVGEGVPYLKEGMRVIGICELGGYAQKVAVPMNQVMPIPDGIPLDPYCQLRRKNIPMDKQLAYFGLHPEIYIDQIDSNLLCTCSC